MRDVTHQVDNRGWDWNATPQRKVLARIFASVDTGGDGIQSIEEGPRSGNIVVRFNPSERNAGVTYLELR